MPASTGTADEYKYLTTTAKKWLVDVQPFEATTVGNIVPRFIRDVNTFIADVEAEESSTTSDIIDLNDRFYVLEAIFRKIINDRF